jgi:RNA polymerase sigma factor (sigma-70 family)
LSGTSDNTPDKGAGSVVRIEAMQSLGVSPGNGGIGFHGSNGRAWLLTIVRNTSYTLLKKNRVADLTTHFDEEIHASDDESVNAATILERSEDAELIREAMNELPAEFREILALRHQEDLSYKEIADIAQISPGTVMSRLARARAKLKKYLAVRIGKEK